MNDYAAKFAMELETRGLHVSRTTEQKPGYFSRVLGMPTYEILYASNGRDKGRILKDISEARAKLGIRPESVTWVQRTEDTTNGEMRIEIYAGRK